MSNERKQARIDRRVAQIEAMIAKIEKATTLRLVLDGEELLHDFDMPGDMYKTMQTVKEAVISEFRADIEGMKRSVN